MAPIPALRVDIREKRFSSSDLLIEGLTLTVEPSQVVALIGASGVGKSTLLRMIAGVDRSYDGKVLLDCKPAHLAPPPGFVFQDSRLLPWLTVLENVRLVAPEMSSEAGRDLLRRVGLPGVDGYYPHQLSGGMQRRVALARALATQSGLLLLDEPFVSLDRILVEEMHALFLGVVEQARPTVIFVSHLAHDAATLADRVLVMASRPAQLVADVNFAIPARERTEELIEEYRLLVETRL